MTVTKAQSLPELLAKTARKAFSTADHDASRMASTSPWWHCPSAEQVMPTSRGLASHQRGMFLLAFFPLVLLVLLFIVFLLSLWGGYWCWVWQSLRFVFL
jgi:hypothetical protein